MAAPHEPVHVTVGPEHAGRRLDAALADWSATSRSAAARWLDEAEATVDGLPVRRSHVLNPGEEIHVPALPLPDLAPAPPLPPVRHRDEHLLVVAKPAGLVVHAGAGHRGDTLVDALQAAGIPLAAGGGEHRPGIVHRLDRDTSGLLVVASTDAAHAGLVAQLRERTMNRRYLALVRGVPPASGTVDAPIGRDPTDRQRFACVPDGKPARTHFVRIAVGQADGNDVSVLACRLETGRTHQIRVHLRAVGHPVLGDDRYGGDGVASRALEVPRVALHAARLGFDHPVLDGGVDLVEPVPEDLAGAFDAAGLPTDWQALLRLD